MRRALKIFVLLTFVAGFASCKKCYLCEKVSLCLTCEVRDQNGNIFSSANRQFCGTEGEIREFENSFKSAWQQNGFTVNCTRSEETTVLKEFCDGPDRAEDEVFLLELAGYICIDK